MPSIKKGVDPDRVDLPPDAKVVAPAQGHEHGYYGVSPDQTPRSAYTVAGVTGSGTAKPSASTKSASRSGEKEASK